MKKGIVLVGTLLASFILISGCGLPNEQPAGTAGTRISSTQTGMHDGYFYLLWTDGVGSVNMTCGDGGTYTVQWTDCGNFIAGMGWNPGSDEAVTYTANFQAYGIAFFSLYGWTTSPLVEYYIVENWGAYRPAPGTRVGSVVSDGGIYDIYKKRIINQISLMGMASYDQYWSVRQWKKTNGTITVQNHFNAWAQHGMNLGNMNFQILATEGINGSGYSNVTIIP